MKTKKLTSTYLPKDIRRFHFSMEAINIKTFKNLTQQEREECMEFLNDCVRKAQRFADEFKAEHL